MKRKAGDAFGDPGYQHAFRQKQFRYGRLVPLSGRAPPGTALVPLTRAGYQSVPRTRGAAVTGEMKYFDADLNSTNIAAVTTTWVVGTILDPLTTINIGAAAVANPLNLCSPVVGAALNQRIGRQIKVHQIKVQGTITVPVQAAQNTADNSGLIRMVIVQDTQTNAAQMTGAQLFQDATAAATTINTYQNPNGFGRFKVLKEKKFTVGNENMAGEVAAANVIIAGQKRYFKCNYKFKVPVVVHFNATNGGTVADIIDNSFHIIIGSDNVSVGTQLAYYSRVSFKE